MKKLCLLISVLLLFGCIVSCENTEEKPTSVTVDLGDYVLIRPKSSDSETVNAALDFLYNLEKQSGLSLPWKSDALDEGETLPMEAKEILFGATNRTESEGMRYLDYSVGYANGRIFINGGSLDAIKNAAKWFFEKCVNGTVVTVPLTPYTVHATYPMEDQTLNGIPLRDFAVEKTKDTESIRLYNELGTLAGISTKSTSSHRLKLVSSDFLGMEEVGLAVGVDGSFELQHSSFLNLPSLAVDWFLNQIRNGEKTMSDRVTVEIPESVVKGIKNASEATNAYLSGVTDRDPLSYTVGDQVLFSISLMADGKVYSCDHFEWIAQTEDGHQYAGTESGKYGRFVVKVPATGTGAIRLKVLAKNEKGELISTVRQGESMSEPGMFGAIVNFDSITQTFSEPVDFDSFWDSQVQSLNTVAPDVLSIEKMENVTQVIYIDQSVPIDNFDFYRVKIAAPSECGFVSGILTVPKDAQSKSCGITVVFNGYGVSDLLPFADENRILFNVCAHSIELGQEASYYTGDARGLKNYGFHNNESTDTCYFRTMILRDLQAVRFIKQYAGTIGVQVAGSKTALDIWNGELMIHGGSQGAFQGIAVAALDHDVTHANWWIPWMCDVGSARGGKFQSEFRPAYTSALRYFDTISFAKRVSSDVIATMWVGLGDYVCPPNGTVALYNALPCTVTCKFRQGSTHGYTQPKYAVKIRSKTAQ